MKRKPTNMLKLSKKPSLRKSAVLAEAENIVKERKKAERAEAKIAVKTEKKPVSKKPAVKKSSARKSPAKKSSAKGTANKGARDPMWKNLAKVLKKGSGDS